MIACTTVVQDTTKTENKMDERDKTPISIVLEYFTGPEDFAEMILWTLTGYPSFWDDCDQDGKCDTETHLRRDLQKIKDNVSNGISIQQQINEYERNLYAEISEQDTHFVSCLPDVPRLAYKKGIALAKKIQEKTECHTTQDTCQKAETEQPPEKTS